MTGGGIGRELLVLDFSKVLGGSGCWSDYICSTGLLIGHSSFSVLFFVMELVGIYVLVRFSNGSG